MKRLNGKLHNTYAKPGMMKLSKPFSLDVELSCLVGWVSYPVRTCQHSWCTLYFLVITPNQSDVCFPPQIQIFQYLCLKKKNTQKVISFLEFRWFFCCSISLGAKFLGCLEPVWYMCLKTENCCLKIFMEIRVGEKVCWNAWNAV